MLGQDYMINFSGVNANQQTTVLGK